MLKRQDECSLVMNSTVECLVGSFVNQDLLLLDSKLSDLVFVPLEENRKFH